MSVVNVKVANIRPKYKNLREWCEDSNNVYVGRAGVVFIDGKRYPSKPSPFANPFKIDNHHTREDVISLYRDWLHQRLEQEPSLYKDIKQLRGKNLGCWCFPEKCHADVLLEILDELSN
jgi:hypothetical protein